MISAKQQLIVDLDSTGIFAIYQASNFTILQKKLL
jgi:hypothetical protein